MATDESGTTQFGGYTWKHWVFLLGCYAVSFAVFDLLIPELPPLWSALLVAALFGGFAIVLPLVLAKRRRGAISSPVELN